MKSFLFWCIFVIFSISAIAVTFGTPVRISGEYSAEPRRYANLGFSGNGDVWCGWMEGGSATSGVATSYSQNDGDSWSATTIVNDGSVSGNFFGHPGLTVGEDGYTYAIWSASDDMFNLDFWCNRSTPSSYDWLNDEVGINIDASADDTAGDIVVSPTGKVVAVVWHDVDTYEKYIIHSYYSDDHGLSWIGPVRVDDGSEETYSPKIAVDGNGRFYIVWSETISGGGFDRCVKLSYSDDAISWSAPEIISSPDTGYSTNVGIGAAGDGVVCCAFRDTREGVWDIYAVTSTDSGQNWTTDAVEVFDSPSGFADLPSVAVDPTGPIYIAFEEDSSSEQSIYVAESTDYGTNWDAEELPGSNTRGDVDIEVNGDGRVFIAYWEFDSFTESIFCARSSDSATDPDGMPNIPAQISLYNATPNPSRGTSKIGFAIPIKCDVELSIYDIKGRKIKTIINSQLDIGEHNVTVEGLQSGIYLYQLQADGYSTTKKMIVE